MKKPSRLFLILTLAVMFINTAHAASGFLKGKVEFIRTHDADAYPDWAPPIFWFTLSGVTEAGSCLNNWNGGRFIFVGTNEQQLSILLASQMAGREVSIHWDDTELVNGWCKARYITTGTPPPLK